MVLPLLTPIELWLVNYGLAAQQLPLALRPTVLIGAARVPVRTAAEYAIIAGFHPAAIGRQGRQAELQQFAHRSGSRRHPVPERKSSIAVSSSGESITCNRSPRISDIENTQTGLIE